MSDERPEKCKDCEEWERKYNHRMELDQKELDVLRSEMETLREKVKIIRSEVVRRWDKIDPSWLMEELDR